MISLLLAIAIAQTSIEQSAPGAPATDRLNEAAADLLAYRNTTLRGYPVTGTNARAVNASFIAGFMLDPYGLRVGGLASWQYGYEFGYVENGACDPALTKITYQAVVTLPDLETRDALSARDKQAWDEEFRHMVEHEAGHLRIGEEGIPAMESAMKEAPTCEASVEAGAAASQAITARSIEYDRVTDHGRIGRVRRH